MTLKDTQKKLEEALAESRLHEELFSSAFEYASIGKALVGLDGRWLRVNEAICKLIGYERDELLRVNFQSVTHPDDLQKDLQYVERMLRGDCKTYQMEKRYIRKDGAVIWALLGVSLVHNADGSPKFFVSQIQDITAAKAAEENLKRANLELMRSNEDLEHFAYIASHDLQEPLRVIASYTGILQAELGDRLSNDMKENMRFIVNATKRMQSLILGILSYSRVSSKDFNFVPLDSNEILNDALANLKQRISESKAQIQISPKMPAIQGDRSQLVQVFQNLIGNAIKFGPKKEALQVSISFQERGDWIEFCIADNGIGISPEFSDQIFLMFRRLHTRCEYEGAGIGLALCKKIVTRHGGRIWVDSSLGNGARFFFTLPKASITSCAQPSLGSSVRKNGLPSDQWGIS